MKKTEYIKVTRKSELAYKNKFYTDGKPRIVMMVDDDGLIFRDEPYGYNKNRQMIRVRSKQK